MKLTPIEGRIHARLKRGPAHPDELVAQLWDEMATRANLNVHISNLRRKGVHIDFDGLYHLDLTPAVNIGVTSPDNRE